MSCAHRESHAISWSLVHARNRILLPSPLLRSPSPLLLSLPLPLPPLSSTPCPPAIVSYAMAEHKCPPNFFFRKATGRSIIVILTKFRPKCHCLWLLKSSWCQDLVLNESEPHLACLVPPPQDDRPYGCTHDSNRTELVDNHRLKKSRKVTSSYCWSDVNSPNHFGAPSAPAKNLSSSSKRNFWSTNAHFVLIHSLWILH